MTKVLATLAAGMVLSLSPVAAFAQDATAPTSQTDTSTPLTPSPPSTPLTPSPTTSPTSGAIVPSAGADSSSETAGTFVQSPVESNRLDPAAGSGLGLQIDPNASNSSVLNSDAVSTVPSAPGVSLNSVQGTTTSGLSSTPLPSPFSTSSYPSVIAEPTSTQTFLSTISGPSLRRGSSSSGATGSSTGASGSMGPSMSPMMSSVSPSIAPSSLGSTSIRSMSSMSHSHSMSGGHR